MAPVLLVRADGQRFCCFAPASEAALASAEKDTDLRQAKVEEHGHAVGAGGRSPKRGFRASSTFRSAASHSAAAAADAITGRVGWGFFQGKKAWGFALRKKGLILFPARLLSYFPEHAGAGLI